VSDNLLDVQISHTIETSNGKLPMEISLQIQQGSILAVTGPSGAGKTTLLRQLAGLVHPDSGRIIFGKNVWFDSFSNTYIQTQKRNIGFVFQDYALFPHLTVRQNLAYGLEKNSPPQIVDELLAEIDLIQLGDRKPFQLSGGQQQRVALARALVRKPDLLLLDEPLSALDHSMRGSLQDLILKFHQRLGFTMIIVTHDLGEIFRLAAQVAIIEDGMITKQGTPSEVYLPNDETNNDLITYGEVLSFERKENFMFVRALIQQKVQELKLPLHFTSEIQVGKSFVLNYSVDKADFRLIDK